MNFAVFRFPLTVWKFENVWQEYARQSPASHALTHYQYAVSALLIDNFRRENTYRGNSLTVYIFETPR